jgi:hypothetical protein
MISYLEKNHKFMEFMDLYRADTKLQSKANIKKSIRLRESGANLMKNLGITQEDVENIFDLIEEEMPEL